MKRQKVNFELAFQRGYAAAAMGEPRKPSYKDLRRADGGVTFSRAYRNQWRKGYDSYKLGVSGQLSLF